MIDSIDKEILNILQENARTPNAEIARQVGMAASAVLERIRKLESRGVIMGYETRLNPKATGNGQTAFVFVRKVQWTPEQDETLRREFAAMPEIQELHRIAGEDCYLLKVRVADTEALGHLLEELPQMVSIHTRTIVVLQTFKETTHLPVVNYDVAEDPIP